MFKKIGIKAGKSVLKKIGKTISEDLEYVFNKTSLNPFDADSLNKGEDEQFYRKEEETNKEDQVSDIPMGKEVSSWNESDVKNVMMSKGYKFDKKVQDKVRSYFEYNYPGYVKYDFSGRRIPSQKRR